METGNEKSKIKVFDEVINMKKEMWKWWKDRMKVKVFYGALRNARWMLGGIRSQRSMREPLVNGRVGREGADWLCKWKRNNHLQCCIKLFMSNWLSFLFKSANKLRLCEISREKIYNGQFQTTLKNLVEHIVRTIFGESKGSFNLCVRKIKLFLPSKKTCRQTEFW